MNHKTVAIMDPKGRVRFVQDAKLRQEIEDNLASKGKGKR